jgi:hypothetical protein
MQLILCMAFVAGVGCGAIKSAGEAIPIISQKEQTVKGTYEWTGLTKFTEGLIAGDGGIKYVFSGDKVTCYHKLASIGSDGTGEYLIKSKTGEPRVLIANRIGNDTWSLHTNLQNLLPPEIQYVENDWGGEVKGENARALEALFLARPGQWIPLFENASVEHGATTVTVSWAQCKPGTICADTGGDEEPALFDVKSDGKILVSPTNSDLILSRKDN